MRPVESRIAPPSWTWIFRIADTTFREFPFRDCPKRGTNNALSANLDVLGGKNGSKSAVLVLCKATGQAPLTLFGQSRKGNSPKFSASFFAMGRAPRRRSAERLTMTCRRGRLNRVQHAMARERVFEGGAQMRPLAIVAGETRVRLGDVGGRTRALRRRPPILLWHGQDLERGLCTLAAAYVHLEDLGLAAGGGELQIALGAVDLPE